MDNTPSTSKNVFADIPLNVDDIHRATFLHIMDLMHDTRHFCTRLRTDVVKAKSRGFSAGKQVITFANARNCGLVCIF